MIVALEGPDGAGKSTVVRSLIAWAESRGHTARVISKWDIFADGVVPAARFLRGSDRVDLRNCIAEMPSPARALFLGWMNTYAATRAQEATEDLVILDGYGAKHSAAEMLAGTPPELVRAISASLPPVDLVVLMDVAPENALQRKGSDLAPYECGRDLSCSPASFLTHQTAVRAVLLDWAEEQGWCVLESDTVEGTEQKVRRAVAPLLEARLSIPA